MDLLRTRPALRLALVLGVAIALWLAPAAVGAQMGSQDDVRLFAQFDRDRNGRLDAEERQSAREYAESSGLVRTRWNSRFGAAPTPGREVSPESVRPYPTTPLYDTHTIRTLFLTFENGEWERELMSFKSTDIDVPAVVTLDGRKYPDVGVQFHGNSSFNGVPIGLKHSMRLAIDFVHADQNIQGYRTLLLLNGHEDPSFLRTLLAMEIARDYFPAPRVNLMRVVINGEFWGVFVNQQQFNTDMTRDLFNASGGARWKVEGTRSTFAGGLAYLGEDSAPYRRVYDIRSKDAPESWQALVDMTRVLNRTSPEALEAALASHLDVDGALRFLAVENAIVNSDGYWSKASDYNLYRDPAGRFHPLPYDVNGTFASGFGPAGSRTGSVWLDPLVAMGDPSKPLAARLLAVPTLRARYLGYVREIALKWLDWGRLQPLIARHHDAIDADVRAETRGVVSYDAFRASAEELRSFVQARRPFLIEATTIK